VTIEKKFKVYKKPMKRRKELAKHYVLQALSARSQYFFTYLFTSIKIYKNFTHNRYFVITPILFHPLCLLDRNPQKIHVE